MPSPTKLSVILLATLTLSSALSVAGASYAANPDPAGRLAGSCPDDTDCDGIPNSIEAAVGGAGIDPVAGTAVTSATQDPAGIHIGLAIPGLLGSATVDLPPGTSAGATPITLEFGAHASSDGPFVVVRGAQLAAGRTKSMAMPTNGMSIVAVLDVPGATSADLMAAPASSRIAVPPCPCPASTSQNVLGAATPYTVTNRGNGALAVSGLLHSAVGMSNSAAPVPAASPWTMVLTAIAVTATAALALGRRRGAYPRG